MPKITVAGASNAYESSGGDFETTAPREPEPAPEASVPVEEEVPEPEPPVTVPLDPPAPAPDAAAKAPAKTTKKSATTPPANAPAEPEKKES